MIILNSYWLRNTKEQARFNKIDKDYESDICIIGGGLTGLSYGYYLSRLELKILYKWNTKDCISQDKIPYIGSYSSALSEVYVATGFNK